jgi:hypothetical protein
MWKEANTRTPAVLLPPQFLIPTDTHHIGFETQPNLTKSRYWISTAVNLRDFYAIREVVLRYEFIEGMSRTFHKQSSCIDLDSRLVITKVNGDGFDAEREVKLAGSTIKEEKSFI